MIPVPVGPLIWCGSGRDARADVRGLGTGVGNHYCRQLQGTGLVVTS